MRGGRDDRKNLVADCAAVDEKSCPEFRGSLCYGLIELDSISLNQLYDADSSYFRLL